MTTAHALHPAARVVLRYCRWSLAIGAVTAYGMVALGPSTPADDVDAVVPATAQTQIFLADGYVAADEAPHLTRCTKADPLSARSAVVRDAGSISTYTTSAATAFDQSAQGLIWVPKWCAEPVR